MRFLSQFMAGLFGVVFVDGRQHLVSLVENKTGGGDGRVNLEYQPVKFDCAAQLSPGYPTAFASQRRLSW